MTTPRPTTPRELDLIGKIAERAVKLYIRFGELDADTQAARFARTGVAFEVLTVHTEIIPLRLEELLAADDGEFAHDVCGIHRHLADNATRPHLTRGFSPRFGHYEAAP